MRVHYRVISELEQPCYMTDKDWNNQTLCGYVRDKTTQDSDKVTCFYCKREL